MRYIRTKDGKIFDVNEIPVPYQVIESWLDFNSQGRFEIIKQADTIKELCDEFVIKVNFHSIVLHDLDSALRLTEGYDNHELTKDYKIYGAIWTDKGLIYVAKMNEKGVLELL